MNTTSEKIGGLNCLVVEALPTGKSPDLTVVLCHGFGAPGGDLVPIGSEVILSQPELAESVQFIFPEAPLSLDEMGMFGGRAWWMIDMMELTSAIERGDVRILREQTPEGLPEARQSLMSLTQEVTSRYGTPLSRQVLGGFSQGSMLATDVALRLPESPAALCIWSGTLLSEKEWRALVPQRKGMPVLQSHGRSDPLLPYQAALWLQEMFTEAELDAEFIEFHGGHGIPPAAMQRFGDLLRGLLKESA